MPPMKEKEAAVAWLRKLASQADRAAGPVKKYLGSDDEKYLIEASRVVGNIARRLEKQFKP